MANYDGLDELEKGLSILLDGLATAVPPADTPPLAIPIA
jgi:hypothetical protein